MTTRERRLAKAERYREWAGKREESATRAHEAVRQTLDMIPVGQPILVGHHSEKRHRRDIDRMERNMQRSVEDSRKAERMAEKAENIEKAAERAIYSDDENAVEALEARIAELEAERERIKAYNASCRKAAKSGGVGDLSLLDEKQRQTIATTTRACSYQLGKGHSMPAYVLSNLGGNITRNRKRLEQLKREAAMKEAGDRGRGRQMTAKYPGECAECGNAVDRGEPMTYYRLTREVVCESCS